ncbi:type 4a pilus biogenesis protein PilO [Sansalvadorimonas sp. 2012CJ34-2]|uniref:Type 4a pilus biogenesis protein PilO n=1 Tax=Parendozoicomonas callyspongiae TaxID=2942213 RepID=A0ABT0PGT1_9GAMM|nr:type 4a pilus biogenesis protein PilO [Sansalvadorimonas sp. 2012CJ34-2]MCL6270589.1 type 4a pilus biogenesis protein PilO [Sansalvadorimonas sp. 2012CJ34-2]
MSSLQESLEKLKGFNVNDLDFENIGSWPLVVKAILCVVAFCLVIFFGYNFHLKDLGRTLLIEEDIERELKDEFKTKAFMAANLHAYRAQMKEMEISFSALVRQLPSDTEVPGLLEDITYTGLGAGLTIDSISLQPEVTHEFYIELPINVSVRGDYHDIGTFVSGVAGLPRIVTLHDFTIKEAHSNVGLAMEIQAKTYRYNDKVEEGEQQGEADGRL